MHFFVGIPCCSLKWWFVNVSDAFIIIKLIIKYTHRQHAYAQKFHIGNGSYICFNLQIKIKFNTILVATQLNSIHIVRHSIKHYMYKSHNPCQDMWRSRYNCIYIVPEHVLHSVILFT